MSTECVSKLEATPVNSSEMNRLVGDVDGLPEQRETDETRRLKFPSSG